MKQIFWIGSSKEDLKCFPEEVQDEFGHGLYLAQMGDRHPKAKSLSGYGNAKLIELKDNARSGTYRAVYTLEFGGCVFVLHAFQKKSKSGIATPKEDLNLIKRRIKDAEAIYLQLNRDNNEKQTKIH